MPHERAIDRQVLRLAEAQHGVVARRQLLALGVSADTIVHRRRAGRLVALHRGVYALGHRALRPEGRWMAAALAVGPTAVLSHRSAAALWGLRDGAPARVEVAVPSSAGRRARDGILVRRIPDLTPWQVTRTAGVPVTSVARTLLDLAAVVDAAILRRAVERAEHLELFDLVQVRRLLDAHPRRPGARALRSLLEDYREHGMTFTRSDLEARFLELCRAHRLPRPFVNHVSGTSEVDFRWPEQRLIVEVDTWTYHGTRAAFARDRARDRAQLRAGLRVARVTGEEIERDGAALMAELAALLAADPRRVDGA
jgi:very-short-patch-repair endonuclease